MKPIKLEINGLNNYKEKTIIDFERLTKEGLFGIFGKMGSGKSTILEAIVIAMYGNASRNEKECINSNCDRAEIQYEFEIGNRDSKKTYQIDRSIIRKSNQEKNYKAKLVEVHNNGQKTIIADNVEDVNISITKITGLTEREFKSIVVIPQGEFNKLLKAKGMERRDILEKIFNLEKYGEKLIYKVRKQKEIKLQDQKYIQTELDKYNNINEETYKSKEKELEKLKEQQNKLNIDSERLINKHQENKIIYEKQNKLEKYENRQKELNLKLESIKIKKKQLEDAINSEKINPHIFKLQKLEKKIEEENFKFDFLQKKLEILNQELLLSKNKYEEAYKLKNDNLSKLSEDKIRVERAKDLEKELIDLEKEIKYLKENNEKLTNKKYELEKTKAELQAKTDVYIKSIKEVEQNISKLKLSQDMKEKILAAYEYEKEYNRILEEKNSKSSKFKNLNKELENLNLKNKYVGRDKNNIIEKLNSNTKSLECILSKCPGKNEDIVNKSEHIINLKLKLDMFNEYEKIKKKIQQDLNEILEKKYNNEREIKALHERLEYINRNILGLEKEIDKLRYLNLANELKKELNENVPCPVCGSRHHDNNSNSNEDVKITVTKEKLDKLKLEEGNIKQKLEILNSELISNVVLEKIRLKELGDIKNKLGENTYGEISNRLQEEQRILNLLRDSTEKWSKEKEEVIININKFTEDKFRIEKEEIKLVEIIRNIKSYIVEIKENIDMLDEKIKVISENYLGLKSVLKIANLPEKVYEINKNEKIIEELNEQYLSSIRNRDGIEAVVREQQNELHQIELGLIKNNEKYEEKHKAKEEKYFEVMSITKGEPSSLLLNNIEEKIKEIITKEEIIKKKLEEQRVENERCLLEKSNIEGQLKTNKEEQRIQESTLNQLLRDYKFENLYSVKRALLDIDHTRLLHGEIMEYEEEQKVLNIKIQEIKDNLSGRRINEEEFKNIKDNIYSIKVEAEKISVEVENNQKNLIIEKEKIKKVEKLKKQLIEINNKVNLLKELYESIENKQFVEYISINKLKDIVSRVNNRLANMTKNRYKLEIDSSAGFIIHDYLNNGKPRNIDTLSGGEEFLVSLCLALEIATQIKLKGEFPLECIFIDEGFGLLDEENIQIVIERLERLKCDNLSIGIISHASEIEDRVPTKLLIKESDTGEGGKIRLEYN